ncbi:MAG: diguanylate cyclase [Rhodoferax sp.]|nr:diguanylate cyclase [Rhodoferax sp.]
MFAGLDRHLLRRGGRNCKHLAFYDALDTYPNCRLLLDRPQAGACVLCSHGRKAALVYVDLDNFKTLNDSQDAKGDLLLEAAAAPAATVCASDTVARLGGDEFVLFLEIMSGKIQAPAQI